MTASQKRGGFKRRTKRIHELTTRETVAAIANRTREIKRLREHLKNLKKKSR
jgi:hypothetical protein